MANRHRSQYSALWCSWIAASALMLGALGGCMTPSSNEAASETAEESNSENGFDDQFANTAGGEDTPQDDGGSAEVNPFSQNFGDDNQLFANESGDNANIFGNNPGGTNQGESDGQDLAAAQGLAADFAVDDAGGQEDAFANNNAPELSDAASFGTAAQAPAAMPLELAPPPASAASESSDAQRKVMYVTRDEAPAYTSQNASGAAAATYMAGDSLVVRLMGAWAEITPQLFIQSEHLSARAVPLTRSGEAWKAQ